MSKKEKARGRRRRKELLEVLGNKCAWCGTTHNLEFDCIIPQGGKHHRMDAAVRMDFYWRQHHKGNIQILCKKDNHDKSVADADFLQKLEMMKEAAALRPKDDVVPF